MNNAGTLQVHSAGKLRRTTGKPRLRRDPGAIEGRRGSLILVKKRF
jgi:hypothetical protein